MIVSFGSKKTEQIWKGKRVTNLPMDIQNTGRRKLRMLNNSQDLIDLKVPPSNRLEKANIMQKLSNIHPGEVLLHEFLEPMGISAYRLSKDLNIPQTRVSQIIKGNRRITADTALRLSKYFGTSAKFWLGLQNDYDIEEESESKKTELDEIKTL